MLIKRFFSGFCLLSLAFVLAGCSTNPATGQQQFTALMSPQQESQIGAQEHQKVMAQYGLYQDSALQSYVSTVGQRVVQRTERPDVRYQFFLLDSPMVNAFALPGGYIYMTRGLMALANSEAEIAAVMAHETGHVTGRHSAERYSRGVVTSLGAALLSSAVGSKDISEALGLGSELYTKSYSRGQESQADSLGLRYMTLAGYHPEGMSRFLFSLDADTALESRLAGQGGGNAADYFSTHPATAERVASTRNEGARYPQQGIVNREDYLRRIDGMLYGDSPNQGFARGQDFYHPALGFSFSAPQGYRFVNTPSQVIASSRSGAVMIFDMVPNKQGLMPQQFLEDVWMNREPVEGSEKIEINGMSAATASAEGAVNGKPMTIRLVAIDWGNGQMARFQIGLPKTLGAGEVQALRSATYSFHRMSPSEINSVRPYRLSIVTARAGDSVETLSQRMAVRDSPQERFRVLNALAPNDVVVAGEMYKIVTE